MLIVSAIVSNAIAMHVRKNIQLRQYFTYPVFNG